AGHALAERATSLALAPPSVAVIGLKPTPPLFFTWKVMGAGVPTTTLPNSPRSGVTWSGPFAVPARAAGTAAVPPVPVAVRVPVFIGGVRSRGAKRTFWVQ